MIIYESSNYTSTVILTIKSVGGHFPSINSKFCSSVRQICTATVTIQQLSKLFIDRLIKYLAKGINLLVTM